jgi:hypothetical protein
MHAVVFQVDFKPDWSGDPEAELDQLTGYVKSSPGFVRGTWTSDGRHGLSFILFQSEATARAVADHAQMPQDASGVLRSVAVYEVARDV